MVRLDDTPMDNLKSLVLLWDTLAASLNILAIDRKTVRRRAFNEGIDFLTVTLPSLGKLYEKYLFTGIYSQNDLSNIRFKTTRDGTMPLLFSSIGKRILGRPIDKVDPTDIKTLRQVTCLFYKLEVPYDDNEISYHSEAFVERDRSLEKDYDSQVDTCLLRAKAYIHKALSHRNSGVIDPYDIVPRHGSGATSCRTPNQWKYHSYRFIPRLDACFPYDKYFFYNPHHLSEDMESLHSAEECIEPHSRLVFVPKDSRGPRAICCEPRELQYIQQGLMRKLYTHIERAGAAQGFVNFTDQTVNQRLALEASCTEELATIDLKEASDRVSWNLVKEIFPGNWVHCLDASRSRFVELPTGENYGPLRKFAAMGSALCFPVEALVFWSLIKSVVPSDVNVWVYGDDIILPKEYVDVAIATLESYELMVNIAKSCYTTPFRESCGGDYFAGSDVGYVKFRHLIKTSEISSWFNSIAFNNEVISCWGVGTGVAVNNYLEKVYKRLTPYSNDYTHSGVLTHPDLSSFRNQYMFGSRVCKDLHYQQYKIPSQVQGNYIPSHAASNHRNEMLRYACTFDKEEKSVGAYTLNRTKTRWSWATFEDM